MGELHASRQEKACLTCANIFLAASKCLEALEECLQRDMSADQVAFGSPYLEHYLELGVSRQQARRLVRAGCRHIQVAVAQSGLVSVQGPPKPQTSSILAAACGSLGPKFQTTERSPQHKPPGQQNPCSIGIGVRVGAHGSLHGHLKQSK